LNELSKKSTNKYQLNLEKIQCMIIKTKNSKFVGTKKYIIKNHYMFNQLKQFCFDNNIKCLFEIDEKQTVNTLKSIEPSYKCCFDCEDHHPMIFNTQKVNRCYIKVYF